ncbi:MULTISPECIES: TetR/AcrR family transcriptional regulator [unclassified Caulobacter]|uniref:TetR/AcrR family transcriptional regulator n=1 Tax=unclassified Caulobacter TaxID=2648921 RepID=UPI000700D478|nr:MULTISPECIES: TetR/AcrR family transcriptional regulator [unclassified Caulobacter]KQV56237.1 hypothetical protein ASC62_20330 [Caulobacter sp. Root342]KQV70588.1 hypothetical protein ASC70_02925 [Caulobacter sp. Root343]
MVEAGGTSRSYASAKREAKAAETRARLVAAAAGLLREPGGAALSLEAVAAAAGVTRLTVYNQFGSRRGLLEAVLDEVASAGGLLAIAEAMALADPRETLTRMVTVFCGFWSSNAGLTGLYAAAGADPELAQSLAARNARRRELLAVLVKRHGGRDPAAQRDVVDLLFALTGFPMFQSLRVDDRPPEAVAALLAPLCDRVLTGD